jgi:hypothetical protein
MLRLMRGAFIAAFIATCLAHLSAHSAKLSGELSSTRDKRNQLPCMATGSRQRALAKATQGSARASRDFKHSKACAESSMGKPAQMHDTESKEVW